MLIEVKKKKKHNRIRPLSMKLHILKTVIFTKSQKLMPPNLNITTILIMSCSSLIDNEKW